MPVHGKRERLQHDHVRIAICDDTGQSIGLAPNKAAQRSGHSRLALSKPAPGLSAAKKNRRQAPVCRRENRRATIWDLEL